MDNSVGNDTNEHEGEGLTQKGKQIREKILREILSTEEYYVQDLKILVSVSISPLATVTCFQEYKNPLHQLGFISEVQSETLFSNIEALTTLNDKHILAVMKGIKIIGIFLIIFL